MDSDRVSVIIPTYNRAALIARAVNSAIAQCESGDEVIIVDDGSTDNTAEVVKDFGQPVRILRTTNAGAGAARNRGVQEAHNPLIAFLDSDDEWMPGKLTVQRALMRARPDILFCFTNMAIRTPAGDEHRFALNTWHDDPRAWDDILGPGESFSSIAERPREVSDFSFHVGSLYSAELTANYIFTSTVMVRRDAGDTLRFAEDLPTYEDWECFGRLARAGRCAYLDCETAWQHGHPGSRLTDADGFICAQSRERIIERIWGSDREFLAHHREQVESVLAEQRLIQVAGLIARGRTAAARAVIKRLPRTPLRYRLLAALPGRLVSTLVRIRRSLRRS